MPVKQQNREELTPSEARVFEAIRQLSISQPTFLQAEIAKRCEVSTPRICVVMRRLVAKGYVAVETGPGGKTKNGAYQIVYFGPRTKHNYGRRTGDARVSA